MEQPPEKRPLVETDFSRCIICQSNDQADILVQNPATDSWEKLLFFVHERGKYLDGRYPETSQRLNMSTASDLRNSKEFYHRTCYGTTCNKAHLSRAEKRFDHAAKSAESSILSRKSGRPSSATLAKNLGDKYLAGQQCSTPLRRSSVEPFNKLMYFFCQEDNGKKLHEITSLSVGDKLRKAVEMSSNDKWKIQLSAALDSKDARAIDIKYHLPCWIQNVQRSQEEATDGGQGEENTLQAAEMEFFALLRSLLETGSLLSMADVHTTYMNIVGENGNYEFACSRRTVKSKIQKHVPEAEFIRPLQRNEPEQILSKAGKETLIGQVKSKTAITDMEILFKAAQILRSAISSQKAWEFKGSLNTEEACDHVPQPLYSFMRWLILGPASDLHTEQRASHVHKSSLALSQNVLYAYKTERQINYKPKSEISPFRNKCE